MSKLLTRADLLAAKLPHEDVIVPELGDGVSVRVQQMTVNTRAVYLERLRLYWDEMHSWEDDQEAPPAERKGLAKPADLDQAVLLMVHSLVNEDGSMMFSEADMPLFNTFSSNAVKRMYESALQLNEFHRFTNEVISTEKKS